jgi:hypothetical protein
MGQGGTNGGFPLQLENWGVCVCLLTLHLASKSRDGGKL